MNNRIIILGAGISGLSAGWRLACNDFQVDILEMSQRVGGLAGTIREGGYSLDFGPHTFFSEDIEIVNTVLKLFNNKLKPGTRQVKFYHRGKYLDYPLTASSVLFQMGIGSGIRAALSFLKGKIVMQKHLPIEGEDETVEDWAIASFGEHLYRTFFKPYTEQFWKVPCKELSSRSIPTHTRMSFANTCRLLLHQRVTKDRSSLIEREALPTYYPDTGFWEITERIAEKIRKAEGNIHLGCEATEILKLPDGKIRVAYEQDGQQKEMDGSYVVSTTPLHLLVKILKPSPPSEILESTEKLDYRALVVLGMVTEKQNILNCNYMYMLDRPYNRIAEMNEFSPATSPSGDNIIAVEFPCLRKSSVWTATKEELFEMSIGSLTEDGFLSRGDVKRLLVIKAPCAYPVYRKDYAEHLKRLLKYVHRYGGLATLGRTGEFMYMDVDKCMRRGFDFADRLLVKYQRVESHRPPSEKAPGG